MVKQAEETYAQAQLLYQQACDKRTDAFAEYRNRLLEYRHATGQ